MTAADVTAYVGSATGLVAVILSIIGYRVRRKKELEKEREKLERAANSNPDQSWARYSATISADRDKLQAQLRESDAQHRRDLAEVRADYESELEKRDRRITELEAQVAELQKLVRELQAK